MNKKVLALVLAVLAMVSLLTACTNSNTNETTPATTTKAESADSTNADGKPTVEEQLKMLSAYKDTFKHVNFDNSSTPEAFYFAITDLDNDGLVEIIKSACTGSGLFTDSYFFEVHEKGRGINSCNPAQINRDSEPDLIVDSTDCYVNDETGERFFIYTDVIRAGASEIYTAKGWYTFRDNRLVYETITSQTISGDTTTYKSTNDEVITEEDFNSAVENYFEGYTKCTATFGWTNFVDENGVEATDLSEEDLAKAITESYTKFSVK